MLTNILMILTAMIVIQLLSMLYLRVQQGNKFVITKSIGLTLLLASSIANCVIGKIEGIPTDTRPDIPVNNELGAYIAGSNTITYAQHHEYMYFFTVFIIGLMFALFASAWFEASTMKVPKPE